MKKEVLESVTAGKADGDETGPLEISQLFQSSDQFLR